jgi:hypothetical protein
MSQTWTLGVAANAAQTAAKTVRRWLDNGVIALRGHDVKSDGSGFYCGLSRARVLQTAITRALLNVGVSLSVAARAALIFSDHGDSDRLPGELFKFGKTSMMAARAW